MREKRRRAFHTFALFCSRYPHHKLVLFLLPLTDWSEMASSFGRVYISLKYCLFFVLDIEQHFLHGSILSETRSLHSFWQAMRATKGNPIFLTSGVKFWACPVSHFRISCFHFFFRERFFPDGNIEHARCSIEKCGDGEEEKSFLRTFAVFPVVNGIERKAWDACMPRATNVFLVSFHSEETALNRK